MSFERVLWLAGMPRSGTNWGSQILASCPAVRMKFCPLFSYEFRGRVDANSCPEQWDALLREVDGAASDYLDQEYLRKDGLVPRFPDRDERPPVLAIKSTRFHDLVPGLLDKVPCAKLIVLVRNPIAAVHSWLSNELEFPAEADPREQWRSGACRKTAPGEFWGFDDWRRTTRTYSELAEASPERVRLLAYEDLVRAPERVTRELFTWAGLPFTAQTAAFLQRSTAESNPHRRSVFKRPDVADRWRAEADPEIVAAIEEELRGDPLERFLDSSTEVAR